jgi:hypothetical protein
MSFPRKHVPYTLLGNEYNGELERVQVQGVQLKYSRVAIIMR